jgi:hypothetical protein
MDDKTRTEVLERFIDDALDRIVGETDMNEVAAHRALTVKALERLPTKLCAEHLEHDLERFANWIEYERDVLRKEAH